ncbi:nuclear transport factor 2 family protein [Streptomyces sennicomposti]
MRAGYRALWGGASPARPERIDEFAVHATADPEVIVVEQSVAGTLVPAGRPFAVPGPLVLRVRDGLPVHVRDYMDAAATAPRRATTRTDGSGPVAPRAAPSCAAAPTPGGDVGAAGRRAD